MTDDDIHATIDRHRQRCPEAANDLIRFAAEIDLQRATANDLADISERVRKLAEGRRKVLELIHRYSANCIVDHGPGMVALGTIRNMAQQCFDSEKANDPSE